MNCRVTRCEEAVMSNWVEGRERRSIGSILLMVLTAVVFTFIMEAVPNVAFATEGLTAGTSDGATLSIQAAKTFKVYEKSHTFDATNYSNSFSIWSADADYAPIKKAKSSNAKVAKVRVVNSGGQQGFAMVTPKKAGTASITLKDAKGRKATVKIKVKANYFTTGLRNATSSYAQYGKREMSVYTHAGAKVTVRIGKERQTKKAKDGSVTFTLKNDYKFDQGYTVTVSCAGKKITKKFNITNRSSAYFDCLRYCSRDGEYWGYVSAYGLTAGDSVRVDFSRKEQWASSYKESWYNKPYLWDTSSDKWMVEFRGTRATNISMHLTITNKYGQQMYSKWYYWTS